VNETIPSPHPRQEAPHAHQVIILPGGQGGEAETETEILTPDLGSDRVLRTRLVGDKLEKVGEFTGFEQGDGPRHAVVHPKGEFLVSDLDLNVFAV
jgi:6-phosphogluconolactonase